MQEKLSQLVLLRHASAEDIPCLYRLRYEAYLPQYGLSGDRESVCVQTPEAFAEQVRAGNTYCILFSGEIVGGLTMEPLEDKMCLKELYVQKEYRGRGIAQVALMHAEINHPCARYRVQVDSGDEISIQLMRSMGYRFLPNYETRGSRVTLLTAEKDASSMVSLALEPLRREHLSTALEWCNSDENRERYSPLWLPGKETELNMTEFSKNFTFARQYVGAAQMDFCIRAVEFNRVIGIISLRDLDWEQHTGVVEHFLLDPKWRGVQLGRRALKQLCELAQEQYGFEQLRLTVLEENVPAIDCFLKSGFVVMTRRQNVMRGGDEQIRTRIIMQLQTKKEQETENGADA